MGMYGTLTGASLTACRFRPTRKQENTKLLKELGIMTLDSLPVIEESEAVTLRTKEEVIGRMISLLAVSLYADGLCSGEDRAEHRQWTQTVIDGYGAGDFFSPKEKAFLDDENPSEADCVNFSWQYEPLNVMLWALGFLSTEKALRLPAKICDVGEIVGCLADYRTWEAVSSHAALRDKEEILDQADLIFRYNWACVEERLQDPQARKEAWGIAMERHKALNWLISYGWDGPLDWDDVTTDT